MHKKLSHSGSSLFLMEMILCILFFSLTSAVCIQLFSRAYMDRQRARLLSRIQSFTVSAAELLKAWDSDEEAYFDSLPLPLCREEDGSRSGFFDAKGLPCPPEKALFGISLTLSRPKEHVKSIDLRVHLCSDGELLFSQVISYPSGLSGGQEASPAGGSDAEEADEPWKEATA